MSMRLWSRCGRPGLAHAFARKNIEWPSRAAAPPGCGAAARAIGPTVVAKSLRDALERPQ